MQDDLSCDCLLCCAPSNMDTSLYERTTAHGSTWLIETTSNCFIADRLSFSAVSCPAAITQQVCCDTGTDMFLWGR